MPADNIIADIDNNIGHFPTLVLNQLAEILYTEDTTHQIETGYNNEYLYVVQEERRQLVNNDAAFLSAFVQD